MNLSRGGKIVLPHELRRKKMKTVIKSECFVWTINGEGLTDADVCFLKKFYPSVYWSDDSSRCWSFDKKLLCRDSGKKQRKRGV